MVSARAIACMRCAVSAATRRRRSMRVAVRAVQSWRLRWVRRVESQTATPELTTNNTTRRRWFNASYWRGGVLSTSEKKVAYRPTSAVRRGLAKPAAMKGPMARKPISPYLPPKTASMMATAETHSRATQVATISMRSWVGCRSSAVGPPASGSTTRLYVVYA